MHLSSRVNKRAYAPFDLVHSDVWDPCPVVSPIGFWYFVMFVNDYSRTTWIYLMKNRSELFSNFRALYAEIHTHFFVSVHNLRSNNAKEYLFEQFQSLMLQNDILHQTSCVDTPSQNGVAERKNRHLLETARTLLFQMHVHKHFWADTISTACFFINRMPSSVLNWATPFQTLFPHKSLFPIEPQVFGCTCFVRDVRLHVSKLDHKSLKYIFLSYSRVQKEYRCYCPTLRRYFVSTNVKFFETTPFSLSSSITSQGEDDDLLVYTIASPVPPAPTSAPIPVKPLITQIYSRRQNPPDSSLTSATSSSDAVQNDDLLIALRKSKRQCAHSISSFATYNHLSSSSCSFIATLDLISLPHTVREALSHPGWHSAMVEEMQTLDDNGTWNKVQLPAGKKVIACRWDFTVKVNPYGLVARLKAQLVAKGYAQTYGVDYSNTFSPVAKMTSVRLFISPTATYNWDLHRLDIKNVFLHGDLQEEVYMEQPLRFVA